MEPLQKLKILLVDRAANYTDEYLSLVLDEAEAEALAYCRREDVPDGLAVAVVRMALVNLSAVAAPAGMAFPHRGTAEPRKPILTDIRRKSRIFYAGIGSWWFCDRNGNAGIPPVAYPGR